MQLAAPLPGCSHWPTGKPLNYWPSEGCPHLCRVRPALMSWDDFSTLWRTAVHLNIVPGQAVIPGPPPDTPGVPGACQALCDQGVALHGAMQNAKFRAHPPHFSLLSVNADPTMQRSSTPWGCSGLPRSQAGFVQSPEGPKGPAALEQSNWCPICS